METRPLPNVPLSPPETSAPRASSSTPVWLVVGAVLLVLFLLGGAVFIGAFFLLGARHTAAVTAREHAVQAAFEVEAQRSRAELGPQVEAHIDPATGTPVSPR